jgi:hypothetical protein
VVVLVVVIVVVVVADVVVGGKGGGGGLLVVFGGRNYVVLTARLRTGRSDVRNPAGKKKSSPKPSIPALGVTQPPIQWVPGHSRR